MKEVHIIKDTNKQHLKTLPFDKVFEKKKYIFKLNILKLT